MNERILNDNRFRIDNEVMSCLNGRKILYYTIVELPIKRIKRNLHGKIISLQETDVYRYLCEPTKEDVIAQYQKYCDANNADNKERSINTFNKLINTIEIEDYDIKKGIVIVDQFNCILDGQHRVCILRNKYGEEYVIRALKLYYLYRSPKILFSNLKYILKKNGKN